MTMTMSKFSKSSTALNPSVRENLPPPFPVVSKMKKVEKFDMPEINKTELIKLELLMCQTYDSKH
jgi:hypothetical protein